MTQEEFGVATYLIREGTVSRKLNEKFTRLDYRPRPLISHRHLYLPSHIHRDISGNNCLHLINRDSSYSTHLVAVHL